LISLESLPEELAALLVQTIGYFKAQEQEDEQP
jgi:hypothetical protein